MGYPQTYLDNQRINQWFYDGVDLQEAYLDNVLVFQKVLRLTLPEPVNNSGRNLRDFINSHNPGNKYKVVEVTNPKHRSSDSLWSGNLNGLDVTLINLGEIQGSKPSWTGLALTSKMRLINEGWIRGAGGRGGKGGKGGKGATNKIKHQTTTGQKYGDKIGPNEYWWEVSTQSHPECQGFAAWMSWGGVRRISKSNTGYLKVGDDEYFKGNYSCPGHCGASHNIYKRTTTYENIEGGEGGEGGAGGVSRFWSTFKKEGANGSPGKIAGHGHSGGNGGKGGTGGDWGEAGERGYTGERGKGPGSPGETGIAGEPAGASIKGSNHLTSDSKIGQHSGPIV